MTCQKCNNQHDPNRCQGHVVKDPETREPIPPRQCAKAPLKGATVCRTHGGSAPQVQAAAAEVIQGQKAARVLESIWNADAAPVLNPVAALQELTGRLQHAANELGARLGAADLDGPTAAAWLRVVRELRLGLEGMERLDLEGKEIALKQDMAEFITTAFRGGLAAAPGGVLTPADLDLMTRTFLKLLGRDDPELVALPAGGAS